MRTLAAVILTTVFGSALYAQASPRYKVEFQIRDRSEGATEPVQHFTLTIDETGKGTLRATKRVAAGTPSQDVEVGAIIQCGVQESGGKAAVHGEIELSRITGVAVLGAISQPIIGQRKLAFDVTVSLSTPTIVVDDGKTNEVQATVTKAN
jgi:hypothetical protein